MIESERILGGSLPKESKSKVESSPMYNTIACNPKIVSITRCPICDGSLKFGSRDPCEGNFYWCEACGDGPICFPLYEAPKPRIAPVVDAEEYQRVLRVVGKPPVRPVIVAEEVLSSPHPFLDVIVTEPKVRKAVDRLIVDLKLAGGEEVEF